MNFSSSSSSSSSSSFSGRPPPHRELQGPRPSPLRLHKDSHKIKKPLADEVLPKPPVIIYMVSPKIIHTNPSDFMSLVQRLTGTSSTSILSPATHLVLEQPPKHQHHHHHHHHHHHQQQQHGSISANTSDHISASETAVSVYPGILSPVPASLPLISPGFFSPSVDPNMLSFLHELSPVFHGNRSYVENTFLTTSPSQFISLTPTMPSPGAWEIFNQFFDH